MPDNDELLPQKSEPIAQRNRRILAGAKHSNGAPTPPAEPPAMADAYAYEREELDARAAEPLITTHTERELVRRLEAEWRARAEAAEQRLAELTEAARAVTSWSSTYCKTSPGRFVLSTEAIRLLELLDRQARERAPVEPDPQPAALTAERLTLDGAQAIGDKRIADLERQLAERTSAYRSLGFERDEWVEECRDLRKRAAAFEAEAALLQQRLTNLARAVWDSRDSSLNRGAQAARAVLNDMPGQALAADPVEPGGEVGGGEPTEADDLRVALDTLEEAHAHLEAERNGALHERDSLRRELEAARSECGQLRESFNLASADCERVSRELEAARAENKRVEQLADRYGAQRDCLGNLLRSLHEQVSAALSSPQPSGRGDGGGANG